MTHRELIPPTPTADDYARAAASGAGDEAAFFAEADPLDLFARWLAEAGRTEPNDPNAMALATVDANGVPDVRMVLLKDFDADGFIFCTSSESAKGVQLAARPRAALLFHWKSLRRQVRLRGQVERMADSAADAFFAERARAARIGAWASRQSRLIPEGTTLAALTEIETARFEGLDVPRPQGWAAYRLKPSSVEFWRDRPFRLHDRLLFEASGDGGAWGKSRLFP